MCSCNLRYYDFVDFFYSSINILINKNQLNLSAYTFKFFQEKLTMATDIFPAQKLLSFEKIDTAIYLSMEEVCNAVANEIAVLIKAKQALGENVVLGLATGATPKKVYTALIRLHKEQGLSFENVITFNLDEYFGLHPQAIQSYRRFMDENLFNHINIKKENCFIPQGDIAQEDVKKHCEDYEKTMEFYGGIDFQILGIGRNGHIGFNEPGSSINSKTRLISLDNSTRIANAYEFGNMTQVPRMAITMGINTILKSKKIILMAWGQTKAPV